MKADDFTSSSQHSAAAGGLPAAARRPGWILHTLRGLEPWVAWSIAACTSWVALVALPNTRLVWLFVLYAGLIGMWAQVHPTRLQAEVFLRGAALLAGAYVLQVHAAPNAGGPTGPLFFWLSITVLYYAFVLRPGWAVSLVGIALAAFAGAAVQLGHHVTSAELLAEGGLLCIFPMVLASRFGTLVRRPDEALEHGRIDAATALYNLEGLVAHGDVMLADCRRDHQPLCMVVLDCSDLLEVRSIYGRAVSRKVKGRIVSKLLAIVGERGLAARTGVAEFTLLLPGMAREKALQAVERVLGHPCRLEFDGGDSEIVLVPDIAMRLLEPAVTTVAQLHSKLHGELASLHEYEQRRQNYLTRERERHSRPMGLVAVPDVPARLPGALSRMAPATLPVPLRASPAN